MKKRKKINLGIERSTQLRIIRRTVGITALCLILGWIGTYLYSAQQVGDTYSAAHIKIQRFSELLFPVTLIFLAGSLAVAALGSLFLPLWIVGAMPRLERWLDGVARADFSEEIQVREGDLFQRLLPVCRELRQALEQRILKLRGLVKSCSETAMELSDPNHDPGIASLRQNLREIERLLGEFKLVSDK